MIGATTELLSKLRWSSAQFSSRLRVSSRIPACRNIFCASSTVARRNRPAGTAIARIQATMEFSVRFASGQLRSELS